MAIHVVNKKLFKGEGVYIGRPSVLGNPFAIGRDGDREEVIARYRAWLWEQVKARNEVFTELLKIKGMAEQGEVYLVCCCKPLACHGDVVKACVDWMIREGIG